MVKDKLPDTGTEYEEEGGGNIDDAFDFILSNFMESNRLWVRMQNQGPMKDKSKREKERHDLRVLVGANLVRLSQLEGMTVDYYAEIALPKIIEHIHSVKDTMSQQYLFESMIQVFPDEYHIRTLEKELEAYTKAQPTVDMKPIMVALMKRLSDFLAAKEQSGEQHALSGVDIFALFRTHLQAILERTLEPGAAGGAPVVPDIGPPLELQAAFLKFTMTLYGGSDKINAFVDIILESTCSILQKYFQKTGDDKKKLSGPGAEKVVELMNACQDEGMNLIEVLGMAHYTDLLSYLNFDTRKKVALNMVQSILDSAAKSKENSCITDETAAETVFDFISCLVKDEDDTPEGLEKDKENFTAEMQRVGRLVHSVNINHPDTLLATLTTMRNRFGQGGESRLVHTLPPVVYAALSLPTKITACKEAEEEVGISVKKVFQFVHKTITVLMEKAPEEALQLWLAAAVVADKEDAANPGSFEAICYEFLTQAFVTFEENISESTKQYQGIFQMVGTLTMLSCLEEENYDTLSQKVVQHSARLLKKPMQCRAISACSQLYWCKQKYEGKRVLECLQKCLKITDAVVQSQPKECGLWVEMLDRYTYFMEKECEDVTSKFVDSLQNLCQEHTDFAEGNNDSKEEAAKAKNHLKHSLAYLRHLKKTHAAFADIEVAMPGGAPLG